MPGMNLRLQKLKETRDLRYIYENELDKSCFAHDMGYGDFQVLASRTASDKILCDKAFYIAKNPKYDGYQRGLASMVYIFFNKKTSATCARSEALATRAMRNKFAGNGIKIRIFQTKNWLKNYTNQVLESLMKEKYTELL